MQTVRDKHRNFSEHKGHDSAEIVFFPEGDTMTPMKFLGTVLVIGFSADYAPVRQAEMQVQIQTEHAEGKPLLAELPAQSERRSRSGDKCTLPYCDRDCTARHCISPSVLP
jgi:hypothetical protein